MRLFRVGASWEKSDAFILVFADDHFERVDGNSADTPDPCYEQARRRGVTMPNERDVDRKNDTRLLTPILLMVLIVVGGFLFYAIIGQAPTSG
jgi:hypothetical protein